MVERLRTLWSSPLKGPYQSSPLKGPYQSSPVAGSIYLLGGGAFGRANQLPLPVVEPLPVLAFLTSSKPLPVLARKVID